MLRTVNVRELKNRLSAYLKDVQHGDVVLVSDRGKVVAEVRSPTLHAGAADGIGTREQRLVDRGVLKLGLANDARAYGDSGIRLAAADIDAALAWSRGER